VLIAEPAEEIGQGARAMMNDGLFEKVPSPDYALALHVEPAIPAGTIGFTPEWSGANVDSVDITIYGRGGHGARPHQAVDPITTAAYLVTQLQTLVSRRVDPLDPAVVTVGSIHGGHKHNIIPDEVHLKLTVRSYSDAVRTLLIDGIRQLARDTCKSFQCPREPRVETREHYTPAVYNDPALMGRGVAMFREVFGEDRVVQRPPSMGGDDFGRFPKALGVPGMYFRIGASNPEAWRASQREGGAPLPSLHSSRFAPDVRPTLRTGVSAMSHLALELLDRP
jgi:amidohydrolase